MKTLKKAILSVAVAASMGAMATTANAGAFATSVLEIDNFFFGTSSAAGVVTDFTVLSAGSTGDFSALTGTNTGSVVTARDGIFSTENSTGFSSITNPALDLAQTCIGSGCDPFGENDFSQTVIPVTSEYVLADMELSGSGINIPGVAPVAPGAYAATRADSMMFASGIPGSAVSEIILSSTVQFSLTADTAVAFMFDATPYIALGLDADATGAASFAQATMDYSITIREKDALSAIFEFNPSALNNAFSLDGPGEKLPTAYNPGTLSYSVATGVLSASKTYVLSINQKSTAKSLTVSEPASLALMGLGLVGLGAMARRKKNKA